MKHIHLSLAHMSGKEEEFIHEAFLTNWVVPLGPNVDGFENDLAAWLGEKSASPLHVVALSSGTAAIHLALVMLGVGPGDEVICQSFTFAASANPIVYQGATPVFVDSEPGTWNMDPELLRQAIDDRLRATGKLPKAIIPVHLYGTPARMDEINSVASAYGIPVVEDAAEALGSEYNGRYCGTFGTYGALSFNGNKMITTSGGGALICPDEESARRVKFYATQARENFPYYQHEQIGYNYRLSNISAGIGRGQMYVLDEHIARRRAIHALYVEKFKNTPGITVMQPRSNVDLHPNYWLSTMLVNPQEAGFTYQELSARLTAADIESRPLWKPMHLQPVFAKAPAYVNGVSEALFAQGLCLPSGPMVRDEDVDRIVEIIKNY
ncbi:DegT/DnrJ/EryC1/StrS family aminotransferase [Phocaeicola coprocola]|uniref:DegT/DnrJ/EryC1/StrS family aminotransferase n=1 Tax=Phocaeicola coprocola TaxID=310298 RepID=UPI001C393BCE|nr:aminotransferase class I/II-fold pyridoxal phosphate-dependent enzyme [Phocaeicola coprocola]MBV3866014.1 aminotransferase class I/II-fold pyridoxal phosphate-dependent enzyme [Phocaeicola coprocola]MBV4007194.1 aminotransferase class I/II-fold pyridoxal phosphate-dependent enzyme [Phocaeicola coprocola]MBV4031715.1 aminotransferase class I/II-fold pyridoxal phosphate-dependent enzyme [Phocaeicola coprocola]MBV4038207.1 aminotransferase class I/II-fold pyridoxal phosphate-dependent enzyme [P